MRQRGEEEFDDEAGELEDDEQEIDADAEAELETETQVTCPYCGEECDIALDPGGGRTQRYVEDCPVCCQPWAVHVSYSDDGTAEAWLEEAG
jgi:transposase-like protein